MAVAVRILNLSSRRDLRTDKALVRDAQAGRAEAVNALVQRHYPRVYSFVSYLSSGKGTAEDLTQEVFTRALAALPRFNGQYQFEPWLLRIARNLVIDEARRDAHRASPTDPNDLPGLEPANSASDHVWESMSQQLAGSLVKRALQQMPMRQRTVLILKEIEGLSYADIAQIIGTNTRGVEATLRRARARFRMEIANAESNELEKATCQRTLRSIAREGSAPESAAHLARCRECRSKASSIHSADKLFGLLPPLVLPRSWLDTSEMVSATPRAPGRSLMQVLRSPQLAMAGPIAQIAEMAAVMVVAGTLTISSAAGQLSRNANIALAAPPAFQTPAIEPSFSGSSHVAPQFAVIDPAPQASEVLASPSPQGTQPGGEGLEALLTFSLSDFEALNDLASRLTSEQLLTIQQQIGSALDSAQLRHLADSIVASSTSEGALEKLSTELEHFPVPAPAPSDSLATTPVPVALPRRRSFTSK